MLQAVDDASCYLPEKLQSEWIDVTKDVHCTVKQANVMHDSEEDCMLGYASLVEDGAKFSHSCLEASLLLFLPAVMKFSHCLEEGELGCVGFFFSLFEAVQTVEVHWRRALCLPLSGGV